MIKLTGLGFDIDQGMVLRMNGQYFHGADAIHALALLSTRSDIFNRLNHWVFKSKRASSLLYPVMRAGRNLLLKLIGVSKIKSGVQI